jgi:NAD+ diphosphatase
MGTRFDRSDYKKFNEITEGRSEIDSTMQVLTPAESKTTPKEPSYSHKDEPPFRLPSTTAIAGVLIRDWVDGKIGFPQEVDNVTTQRGNL